MEKRINAASAEGHDHHIGGTRFMICASKEYMYKQWYFKWLEGMVGWCNGAG